MMCCDPFVTPARTCSVVLAVLAVLAGMSVLSGCTNGPFSSQSVDIPQATELSPNDPFFANGDAQWYLSTIGAPATWGLYEANAGLSYARHAIRPVIVSVIDSGVVAGHEDLKRILTTDGMYFIGGRALSIPQGLSISDPSSGHGTHVSGLIAAEGNNDVGISGAVYNGWSEPIAAIRTIATLAYNPFTDRITGAVSDIAAGIIYATGNDSDRVAGASAYAAVMNMSLGTPSLSNAESLLFENALALAAAADVVVVAASGNKKQRSIENPEQYKPFVQFPARYDEVIAVGSVDRNLNLSTFSQWGIHQELVAPGATDSTTADGMVSTYRPSGYAKLSGTSFAAPLVAAVAAIVRSANPYLSATEVRTILRETARDLGTPGYDQMYGYGLVDMEAAFRAALRAPYGRFSSSRAVEGGASEPLSPARRGRYDEANALSVWDPAGRDIVSVIISATANPASVWGVPGVVQIDQVRIPDGILLRLRLANVDAAATFEALRTMDGVLLITQEREITFID